MKKSEIWLRILGCLTASEVFQSRTDEEQYLMLNEVVGAVNGAKTSELLSSTNTLITGVDNA